MSDYRDIEREAAAERQNLASSLDALSAAVNPDNMKQHAAVLAEHYGGDLGRQAWGAAKQNPAAFALLGAGLGLLFTGTGTRPESRPPEPTAVPPEQAFDGFDERVAAADAKMNKEMSGMIEQAKAPRAAWLREKLNDGLDALPASAQERVLKARKAALNAQEAVEAQAHAAAKQTKTFMNDQPMAVGAIAVGLGALIGSLLPSTRREDHLLGERRDATMAAAKATLQGELNKAHNAARSALGAD